MKHLAAIVSVLLCSTFYAVSSPHPGIFELFEEANYDRRTLADVDLVLNERNKVAEEAKDITADQVIFTIYPQADFLPADNAQSHTFSTRNKDFFCTHIRHGTVGSITLTVPDKNWGCAVFDKKGCLPNDNPAKTKRALLGGNVKVKDWKAKNPDLAFNYIGCVDASIFGA